MRLSFILAGFVAALSPSCGFGGHPPEALCRSIAVGSTLQSARSAALGRGLTVSDLKHDGGFLAHGDIGLFGDGFCQVDALAGKVVRTDFFLD